MSNSRIEHLEFTLMELGSEVFQLKHDVVDLFENFEQLSMALANLRDILNEKGYISKDDFEDHISRHEMESSAEEMESEPMAKDLKRGFH